MNISSTPNISITSAPEAVSTTLSDDTTTGTLHTASGEKPFTCNFKTEEERDASTPRTDVQTPDPFSDTGASNEEDIDIQHMPEATLNMFLELSRLKVKTDTGEVNAGYELADKHVVQTAAATVNGVHEITMYALIKASPKVVADVIWDAKQYASDLIGTEGVKCTVTPIPSSPAGTTRAQQEVYSIPTGIGPSFTLQLNKTRSDLPNNGGSTITWALAKENMAMKTNTGHVQILPHAEQTLMCYKGSVTSARKFFLEVIPLKQFQEGLANTVANITAAAEKIA